MYAECVGCNNYHRDDCFIEEDIYYCDKELIPDTDNNEEPSCYEKD